MSKQTVKVDIQQYVMVIALAVVIVLFSILTNGILLKPLNISNLISQNAYILILAVGMVLCIIAGGNIDLSVGSVAGFIGAISVTLILKQSLPVPLAIFLSLLVGLLIGMWHGFWIAYVGVPSFIVTLGGMLIFRGFTLLILQGTSLAPLPDSYQFIAAGFLPDIAKVGNFNLLAISAGILFSIWYTFVQLHNRKRTQKYGFATLAVAAFITRIAVIVAAITYLTVKLSLHRGLPTVLVIITILVVVYTFATQKTIPGRHIYAYGGNKLAAKLSGVNTRQVLFWVYANMGLLAAVAGIIFTGRLNSATPKTGVNFELDAIAACFIGGASMSGGVGTVIGAIVGGLLMGVLNNGMSIIGVSIDWQQAIKGLILVFAVAFDVYSKSGREFSILSSLRKKR